MRAEDPAFLVLHLDTNAAPAVDGSHDNAAPRRSDARADSPEAHTVAALELFRHFFSSFEAQGTWRAGPDTTTLRRAQRHLAVVNFPPRKKDLGDDVARLGASSNGPRCRAGAVPTLLFGLARR